MKLKNKPQAKPAIDLLNKSVYDQPKPYHKSTADVPNAEFVQAWMRSTTLVEVARKTGLTSTQASTKATYLREKGVKLPLMVATVDKNSVEALNKLVERLSK